MSGIISKLKQSVQSTGGSKGKFINKVRADKKARIRFLQELDTGLEVTVHESYQRGVNAVCRTHFNESCPFCDDNEDITTRSKYCWSVWDVEEKEVKIFMWQATSRSPVNFLLSYYETYGTIMDRDYVVERKGTSLETTYNVIPMDKSKFRNESAKPYSNSAIMKLLDKAFPAEEVKYGNKNDDDEDDVPFKKDPKSKSKAAVDNNDGTDIEWIEGKLDENDIDEDEFIEYFEIKSLKSLTKKSKKQIKEMITQFVENEESDEDDDDDDDEE